MIGLGATAFHHESFNVPVPFNAPLHGFRSPQRIRIVGIPDPNAVRFQVNLMNNSEYHLHFNPRFDENVVVRNTTRAGAWQNEERYENEFPFFRGKIFTLDVISAPYQFVVNVNGRHFISFNHREDPSQINRLEICGDVTIHSVNVETKGAERN